MYNIINDLPICYDFRNHNENELELYKKWFIENKNKRLNELKNIVNNTIEFEEWKSDLSVSSLEELGKWLIDNTKTEKLSKKEFEEKKNKFPSYIDVQDWDFTIKTKSILIDVGIYLGEVVINNNNSLKWRQYTSKNKKDIDYGHMVIQIKNDYMNPVWLIYIQGLKIAHGTSKGKSLLSNLYAIWTDKAK